MTFDLPTAATTLGLVVMAAGDTKSSGVFFFIEWPDPAISATTAGSGDGGGWPRTVSVGAMRNRSGASGFSCMDAGTICANDTLQLYGPFPTCLALPDVHSSPAFSLPLCHRCHESFTSARGKWRKASPSLVTFCGRPSTPPVDCPQTHADHCHTAGILPMITARTRTQADTGLTLRAFVDNNLAECFWQTNRVAIMVEAPATPEAAAAVVNTGMPAVKLQAAAAWQVGGIWISKEEMLATPRPDAGGTADPQLTAPVVTAHGPLTVDK